MSLLEEERFPEDICYGSSGGPEFSTSVTTSYNQFEQRNINWNTARMKYNIVYDVKSDEELLNLLNFFYTHKGRAIGFRFKDWADYKANNQYIDSGDGEKLVFQLIKTYKSNANIYTRIIKKPVKDSVKIYFTTDTNSSNKSLILEDYYVIDYKFGKLTFKTAPSNLTKIYADFEFDVPVRFDTDYLSYHIDSYKKNRCDEITLIEIKN